MSKKFIQYGFIAAGVTNVVGGLIFSKFFSNDLLSSLQPDVLSNFSIISIILWGLAYITVAKNHAAVKWLVAVFAIEKLAYAVVWAKWITTNDVSQVFERDMLTGIFYSIYGPNDFTFGVFFAVVTWQLFKK
jgi:hypothetical protein